MAELKPCPNCGTKACIETGNMLGLYRGRCCSYFCDTTGPETDDSEYAAELWNEMSGAVNKAEESKHG